VKKARDPDAFAAALVDRGLTHRQVATLAGCSRGWISNIRAGQAVNDETARRIARVLKRPLGELFADAESSVATSDGKRKAIA
jgi:transcriptional regulator with XRE-family HTH domain